MTTSHSTLRNNYDIMPKAGNGKNKGSRHDPLHVQMDADASLRRFGRVTAPDKRKKRAGDEDAEEQVGVASGEGAC